MIFPDIEIGEWCKKIPGLRVEAAKCNNCRTRLLKTTLPFIEKDWVGLIAPKCDCGFDSGFSTQVSNRQGFHEFWNELASEASFHEEFYSNIDKILEKELNVY